jgi:hypothetical protein
MGCARASCPRANLTEAGVINAGHSPTLSLSPWKRGHLNIRRGQFWGPLSHGERDRVRGGTLRSWRDRVSAVAYARAFTRKRASLVAKIGALANTHRRFPLSRERRCGATPTFAPVIPAAISLDRSAAAPVIARLPWQPWRSKGNISDLPLDCFAPLAMTAAISEQSRLMAAGIMWFRLPWML